MILAFRLVSYSTTYMNYLLNYKELETFKAFLHLFYSGH